MKLLHTEAAFLSHPLGNLNGTRRQSARREASLSREGSISQPLEGGSPLPPDGGILVPADGMELQATWKGQEKNSAAELVKSTAPWF
ncbi:MAG: hypothetical protein OEM26_13695 [Saprospiraceae bacterium]|nr:hypothetical protein [Saprospiraceae bacterium]